MRLGCCRAGFRCSNFHMARCLPKAKSSERLRSRKFAKRPIGSVFHCSRKATTGRPRFITIAKTGRGTPFHYFAYGAAVSEVEVDGFTGDYRLLRTDILEDVGDSVSPLVDRGQIEGGFIQGVGWLTLEELVWDAQGRLATAGASTYKLPSWTEVPDVFNVNFLERAAETGTIFGSKAVGEPPLMLAISVREAICVTPSRIRRGRPSALTVPPRPSAFLRGAARARGAGSAVSVGRCSTSDSVAQGANCCARPCFTRRAIRFKIRTRSKATPMAAC